MQYRPFVIPFEASWRWFSLPTEVAPPITTTHTLIRLPRSHDVQGVRADGTQPMPGDGYRPYGNALDFGIQIQAPTVAPFLLAVSVVRHISSQSAVLLAYTFAIVPPSTAPFYQNIVAFEGFTADAWEIVVQTLGACTLTAFGYAGWGQSKRLARDPLAVVVTEPVFV